MRGQQTTADVSENATRGAVNNYAAIETRRMHNQPIVAKRLDFYGKAKQGQDFADDEYEKIFQRSSNLNNSNKVYYEPINEPASSASIVYTPDRRRGTSGDYQ